MRFFSSSGISSNNPSGSGWDQLQGGLTDISVRAETGELWGTINNGVWHWTNTNTYSGNIMMGKLKDFLSSELKYLSCILSNARNDAHSCITLTMLNDNRFFIPYIRIDLHCHFPVVCSIC